VTVLPNAMAGEPLQFSLVLSSATNSTITRGTATGTILNSASSPTISIDDVSIAEGNSGTSNAVFHVTLSAASGQTVLVNYNTTNGTALAGPDYTATSGQLSFAPGQTVQTITVPILGNMAIEPDRMFSVLLSGAQHALIGDASGTGTILDDDAPRL